MTYRFSDGDFIATKKDGLVHLVRSVYRRTGEWATVCRRFDDWSFRGDYERGAAMRAMGPATCLDCVAGKR